MRGLILSAPASGSGKTMVTLGLLRALTRRGTPMRGAKSGPDYIDPRFHAAACGRPCRNLDAWAMTPARLTALAAGDETLLIEGAMGLFDGAPPEGRGATADLARLLGLPVVLVIDAASMAQSVAPLVAGFARQDPRVDIGAVILNRVGSPRHARMLRDALAPLPIPVIGAIPRSPGLSHPSRHLGLVQAAEHSDLAAFLDAAADLVAETVDLDALQELAEPLPAARPTHRITPPAQTIALAEDDAFAFAYPHILEDWRARGAEIRPFSPLADQPVPQAGLIVLPGGYPELHAGRLAAAETFMSSLRNASEHHIIYGECGGYMTLGKTLTDAEGTCHRMAGLLPHQTSFATRRLSLGYRRVEATTGPFQGPWTAHEFHYATVTGEAGPRLFTAQDAEGNQLAAMGLIRGNVSGSFAHLIDIFHSD